MLPIFSRKQIQIPEIQKISYLEQGQKRGKAIVEERYEGILDYHNLHHTETVVTNVEKILKGVKSVNPHLVSEEDIALGKFVASFHDTVENWEKTPAGKRKMDTFGNEVESIQEAINYMREVNAKEGAIFSDEDMEKVREAIITTIPVFEKGTVIQPNVTKKTPIIARALALADLGSCGLEEGKSFFAGAVAFFREDNMDIKDILKGNLDESSREALKKRMIDYLDFEKNFIHGRKERFEQEIDGDDLKDPEKAAIRNLFTHFDSSFKYVSKMFDTANKPDTNFENLLLMFGYKMYNLA